MPNSLLTFGCDKSLQVGGVVAPILFFPLLADALLTLLYRARRGRRSSDVLVRRRAEAAGILER